MKSEKLIDFYEEQTMWFYKVKLHLISLSKYGYYFVMKVIFT